MTLRPRLLVLLAHGVGCRGSAPAAPEPQHEAAAPSNEQTPKKPDEQIPATNAPAPDTASGPQIAWEQLEAQSIYVPNPSLRKLAQTEAAAQKTTTRVEFSFCVDAHGVPGQVHIVSATPPDDEIEGLVEETVRKWRFRPPTMFSEHEMVCTRHSFRFTFE